MTKSYWSEDGKKQTKVLLPLSLNIAEGEIVMFLGPSGCGKTTLMRIVGGLEKQDKGSIRLAGDLLAGPDQRRGMVFQSYSSFPWLTVRDNIKFGTLYRRDGNIIKGTWKTGEKEFFARFADLVTFRRMGEGFTWDTQDRDRDIAAARAAWQVSCEMLTSGDYDLVILDELNIVLRYEYLSVDEVLAGLTARDPRTTVVVTGRDAPPALLEVADLVTEMTNVKHPFDAGIKAARGFDF